MNKTKKIILFISLLILLFSLESILLNITIDFDPGNLVRERQIDTLPLEEEPVAKPPTLEMKKRDCIQNILFEFTAARGK
jgi:hypothetical protein